jgi:hypothetical protein
MRRRDFVRGIGLLTGAAAVGGAVSTVGARRGLTVQQVVEGGVPQPQSLLTLDLSDGDGPVTTDQVHVWTLVRDPESAQTRTRPLTVSAVSEVRGGVRLVVDGPVSQGAVISVTGRPLVVVGANASDSGGQLAGELSPEQATQWFKAYEPTNPGRFDPAVYPSGTDLAPGVDDDAAAVRDRLESHLERFVDRDRLTGELRDRALDRFDDPLVRRRFVDSEGAFDPEMLAGVLANAGTVARGIDAVILGGENQFGHPYTVRRQPTFSGGCMEVQVNDGTPTILVDPVLDGEPFVVLAPLFAHEGLHQDLSIGLDEEVIATYVEALVWAEHVLADPTVARLGTAKTRQANTMLLVALNSGAAAFPQMGVHAAPHRQAGTNAVPRASKPVASFASAVEAKYIRTPQGTSPGSAYSRQVLSRITGIASEPDFDAETLALLDGQTRLFSAVDIGTLLTALELRLAPSASTTPPAGPDPVAVADARGTGTWVGTEHSGVGAGPGRLDVCGTCLLSVGE